VSAAASGKTILDRREAFILEKPLFRRALAVKTAKPARALVADRFGRSLLVTNP
jgi:hypothetical protein